MNNLKVTSNKIFIFLLLGICLIGLGSSADCNYTGTTIINSTSISDGCSLNVAGTYTMSGETFELNGSATDRSIGAFNVTASNIIIDLNGSTIIGNFTNTITGIQDTGEGSRTAFFYNEFENITIQNGTISNYESDIYQSNAGLGKHRIINVTFINSNHGIWFFRPDNFVYNSTFNNTYVDAIRMEGASASRNTIEYNSFIGGADGISLSSTADNSGSNTVRFNNFSKSYVKYGILLSRSNDNLIEYNRFNGTSVGIGLPGLNSNNIIRHNIFTNSSNGTNNYDTCLTCYGIHQYNEIGADDNLTIYNNSFYLMQSAMVLANLSSTNISFNYINDSIQYNMRLYNRDNLTLESNTFANSGVLELFGGGEGLTSPFPIIYNLYSNYFQDVVSEYRLRGQDKSINIYSEYLNDYYKFRVIDSITDNLSFYSLTNALIYNTNGSVYGSTTISENDGNVNITLQPNNASYVLDNFNLTQGITRTNSPLSISGDDESKTITSTLSDTITVPVIFDVDTCDGVGNIIVDGTTVYQSRDYSCSNNQVTIILPLDSSTTLEIQYGCSALTKAGYNLVMILASLLLLSFMIWTVKSSYENETLTVGKLILMFVILMVCLGLWLAAGQNLGGSCGVVG